jgi:hypothetical protein
MITGYSRLTPWQARVVLAILTLATLFCIGVAVSPLWQGKFEREQRGEGDVALFRAMVDRMRNGVGFYQASAAEMTARGYPTRSVFNWRMPLPFLPLSKLPRVEWARYIFGALSLLLMILAFEALARDGDIEGDSPIFAAQVGRKGDSPIFAAQNGTKGDSPIFALQDGTKGDSPIFAAHVGRKGDSPIFAAQNGTKGDSPIFAAQKMGQSPYIGFGCVVLLSGPLLFDVLGDLYVMPELWAGVLIALSLCAYGIGRPKLGMGFGLIALFVRELALPYCLLCAGMALLRYVNLKKNKVVTKGDSPIFASQVGTKGDSPIFASQKLGQSPEMLGWAIGLTAWLIFWGWHWWNVSGMIGPEALSHKQGWIRFGGAGFVLATAQMNAYLLLLPPWVAAMYFAFAMFGLGGWHTALGTRIGLTVCLYALFFAVVGQDFNQYWGSLIAPLLCFGAVRFPCSMRDLCRVAGISPGRRKVTSRLIHN